MSPGEKARNTFIDTTCEVMGVARDKDNELLCDAILLLCMQRGTVMVALSELAKPSDELVQPAGDSQAGAADAELQGRDQA